MYVDDGTIVLTPKKHVEGEDDVGNPQDPDFRYLFDVMIPYESYGRRQVEHELRTKMPFFEKAQRSQLRGLLEKHRKSLYKELMKTDGFME